MALPRVTSDDPQQLSDALAQHAQSRPAANWAGKLQVTAVDERSVTVAARPGQGQIISFVRTAKHEELASMLGDILGRRVDVRIESAMEAGASPQPSASASRSRRTLSQQQRQDALQQPLVRELLSEFDATLIDIRDTDNEDESDTADT